MEALKQAVRRYADAHANADGVAMTPIAGVGMIRVFAPTAMLRTIYKPLLCLVLQGAKQVTAGETVHAFAAGQSVIVSVDLPIVGRIVRASRAEPYLALALDLDMGMMRDVAGEVETTAPPVSRHEPGLFVPSLLVDDTDEAVADCALRLMRLLDRPEAVPVLRASIFREMHYWLLTGRHGAAIRPGCRCRTATPSVLPAPPPFCGPSSRAPSRSSGLPRRPA